jgi:hypothetical protein
MIGFRFELRMSKQEGLQSTPRNGAMPLKYGGRKRAKRIPGERM